LYAIVLHKILKFDKGSNRAHVGEDNFWLIVPYVTYFALGNMLENIFKALETHWEIKGNPWELFESLVGTLC
jgi:hypothetical protein